MLLHPLINLGKIKKLSSKAMQEMREKGFGKNRGKSSFISMLSHRMEGRCTTLFAILLMMRDLLSPISRLGAQSLVSRATTGI